MIPAGAGTGVLRFILLPDVFTGSHARFRAPSCGPVCRPPESAPVRLLVPIVGENRCLILTKPLPPAIVRCDATMDFQGRLPVPRQNSHMTVANSAQPAKKPAQPRDPVASGQRDAAQNRAASHNYFLLDKFEAGVALRGTEVKSIREGKANLKDAYGLIKDGEAYLLNLHIGPYSHGNIANHDETRTRKLLLHREEVRKLLSKTQIKGHTLIPTRLYFRNGRVKCELALAKGKQDWDKRETERRREADREARAAIKANKHRGGR